MHLKMIVASLALVAAPAFAADSGFFVAGSAGRGYATTNTAPGTSANDSFSTWAIGGGYRFNQYVGLEANYRDYGQLKTQSGVAWSTADLTGWTYGGFVAYPVADAIELTARAGWNRWQSEWQHSTGASGTLNGTEPYWGAGLSYSVTPKAAIGANWTRFKSAYASTEDADLFEISLQYRF